MVVKKPLKLTGIGLRGSQCAPLLEQLPQVAWVEIPTENFFGEGGQQLCLLELVSQHYPVSFHGQGLSLGSSDELNWQHLKKLRDLVERVNPCLISDHLAWSSLHGQYFHDVLPLPYTEESLSHIANRIDVVQDYLGRQILIENIAGYMQYEQSTISESQFLAELVQATSCGIVLDLSNMYITTSNFGISCAQYFEELPAKAIQEIHLAGITKTMIDGKEVLVNHKNQPISAFIWQLYRQAISYYGPKATIVEWDNDLPSLDMIVAEAEKAEFTLRDAYAAKHTV